MQEIKNYYVYALFTPLWEGKAKTEQEAARIKEIKNCMLKMEDLRDKATRFYSEIVDKVLDEEMLVVDGCFALETLYRNRLRPQKKSPDNKGYLAPKLLDAVFGSELARLTLRHDLMLLENRLPSFVFIQLFDLTVK